MKNQVLCTIAAMATLFFVNGCVKPAVEPPVLSLETTEFTAEAEGGTVTVPFELKNATEGAVVGVKPVAEYDWVEVSSVGEAAIELSVAKNESTESRTAEFTVTYPGISADAKFTLSQLGAEAPELSLESASADVSAEGSESGTVGYTVTNPSSDGVVSVTVEDDVDWVSAEVDKDASLVRYSVAANKTTEARSAVLTVSYPGASDVEFTVNQAAGTGSAYDYEWNIASFASTWYGDQYGNNGEHNYYTTLYDMPLASDGTKQEGCSYFIFDLYAGAPEDESAPMIPAGTYALGDTGTEEWTFSSFSRAVLYSGTANEVFANFKDGTLTVSYEGTTLNIDGVLTDADGKTHHLTYSGDGICEIDLPEDPGDEPAEPGFGADVEFEPASASASYSGDDGVSMQVQIQLTDMVPGEDGSQATSGIVMSAMTFMPLDAAGKIAAGTYNVAYDGTAYTMLPGMDIGVPYGTYAEKYADGSDPVLTYVAEGSMTISESDGAYAIDFDFVCVDGYKLSGSWTGELGIAGLPGQDSDQ